MTLIELINNKRNDGFESLVAQSLVGQDILIKAIQSSNMVDRTLIKGGVLMYNITKNNRRASRDLDFDLIRYDISNDKSIDEFVSLLNKSIPEFEIIRIGNIEELRQEDYRGKRAYIQIRDKSYSFTIKLDIGVHTLFAIEQEDMEFNCCVADGNIVLKVNPVEQVIAEKLYSLAKLGIASTRYKDIYDIYYLINHLNINKNTLLRCIDLLIKYGKNRISDLIDFVDRIIEVLESSYWKSLFFSSNVDWLDIKDKNQVISTIIKFVDSLY